MQISIVFHLLGMVMWLGGVLILTRVMVLTAKQEGDLKVLSAISERLFYGFILPGAAISLLTGMFQAMYTGMGSLMSQGWFHGKLTLVILQIVLTAMLFITIQGLAEGRAPRTGRVMTIHGCTGLTLLGILFLTLVLRR